MANLSQSNTDFYGNPILKDEGGAYKVLPNGVKDYSAYQDTNPSMPYKEGREQYENKLREKAESTPAVVQEGQAPTNLESMGKSMGTQMASQGAQSGNAAQLIGGAAMMTGNPALMAGGLGLQVLASGEANKRAEKEKQRQEYNARIAERQQLLQQIASNKL